MKGHKLDHDSNGIPLKDHNAYWVKSSGNSWLAVKEGDDFWIMEDRWTNVNDEDITEIYHIPFPEGFEQECF